MCLSKTLQLPGAECHNHSQAGIQLLPTVYIDCHKTTSLLTFPLLHWYNFVFQLTTHSLQQETNTTTICIRVNGKKDPEYCQCQRKRSNKVSLSPEIQRQRQILTDVM